MEKKKILILCASLKIGGAEKVAQSIALYAPENTFEFHYLVFHSEEGQYEAELRKKGCVIHRLPEPSLNYFVFWTKLWKLIRKYKFYAVHGHTMFHCGTVMLIAYLLGVPVRISHAHSALDNGYGLTKRLYENLMRFLICKYSTHLVSCGTQAGIRLFGEASFARRGILIPNGINISRFCYDEVAGSQIRTKLHLQDAFVLGQVGHMCSIKNQEFSLELMPSILKVRPNAHLMLLGDGADRGKLMEKAHALGLDSSVTFTGNVENVWDYLSAMDVFLFPSRFEGMPLSVLEAQANGLPCVLSDCVPPDVYLTDLIHPLSLDDPSKVWAETIFSLCRKNPIRYNHLLMESDFSVESAVVKICRIYGEG